MRFMMSDPALMSVEEVVPTFCSSGPSADQTNVSFYCMSEIKNKHDSTVIALLESTIAACVLMNGTA